LDKFGPSIGASYFRKYSTSPTGPIKGSRTTKRMAQFTLFSLSHINGKRKVPLESNLDEVCGARQQVPTYYKKIG